MSAFNWKGAMSTIEDDIDFTGMEYYDLPNGQTIHKGDSFWDVERGYQITVTGVKTKVHTGHVGPAGTEADDYVFYEMDWSEPTLPDGPRHYTDDIHWMSVDDFAEKIEDDDLLEHRGNGLYRPP